MKVLSRASSIAVVGFFAMVALAYAVTARGVSLLEVAVHGTQVYPVAVHVAFPCGPLPVTRECYEDFYRKVVERDGVIAAINDLKGRFYGNEMSSLDCHYILHSIAFSQWEKTPDMTEAFTYGDGLCLGGYYHGIVIRAVDEEGRVGAPEDLRTACEPLLAKGKSVYDMSKCAHGLGHGIMLATGHDLSRSVPFCASLPHAYMSDDCEQAVFMEYAFEGKKDAKNPLFPCDTVAPEHAQACFSMHSVYLLDLTTWKTSDALALCDPLKSDEHRRACYRGIGKSVSTAAPLSDIYVPGTVCGSATTSEQYEWCAMGTLENLIYYTTSRRAIPRFCAALPPHMRPHCKQHGEEIYRRNFEGTE